VEALNDHGVSSAQVRVYRGYSGWGPGQMDHELRGPGWLVVDAMEHDPFVDEPWTLWRRVLARQRGDLAWMANFPDDLSAN
jgi:putative transcriptional regulator